MICDTKCQSEIQNIKRFINTFESQNKENSQSNIFNDVKNTPKQDKIESQAQNVCRIEAHTRVFDWKQPPNKSGGTSGVGTGFVLKSITHPDDETIYVITAHHVIQNAIKIRVKFTKLSSEYTDAEIIGLNPQYDLALIAIKSKPLKKLIPGFDVGNSDKLKQTANVTALGFALGKDHLQTTIGVISGRISDPSRLQTNCDVNPGNSGGPLVQSNDLTKVIGLVTSGLTNANAIYYAAPINEALIMVQRMLNAKQYVPTPLTASNANYDRIPSLNCSFTKCNSILLDHTGKKNSDGIYCTAVHHAVDVPQTIDLAIENLKKHSGKICVEAIKHLKNFTISTFMTKCKWKTLCLKKFNAHHTAYIISCLRNDTIRKGDIVCCMHINGKKYEIDTDMSCQFDFWSDRLTYSSIFDRLSINDVVKLDVWRKVSKYELVTVNIKVQENKNTFRKMYPDVEHIPFVSLGGIFIMPLLANHLPLFKDGGMTTLMNTPSSSHTSHLLITHIMAESPFKNSKTVAVGDMIISINGKPVQCIKSLMHYWKQFTGKNEPITLHMRDGSLGSSTIESINSAHEKIINEYGANFVTKFE